MRGRCSLVARVATVAAGALLLAAGCGGSSAHTETPSSSTRAAVLRAVDIAFFSTTGASPGLRLTSLQEAGEGSTDWARVKFAAAKRAPAATKRAVAAGHNQGLLRHAAGGDWTWLGYLAAGASCRTAGRSAPGDVAQLLHLPPACTTTPGRSAPPPEAATGGAVSTTLSSGDQVTLLSIFVTSKNAGSAGQVLTPSTITVSPNAPPRAALVPGNVEWAMVTYVPAPGAPEPLTSMELQNGSGTAFYSKQPGQGWTLRGLAGQPFCSGARAAGVPPSALTLWDHRC